MKDETPSTELTVTARAALALGSDKTRTELAELVKKSANILEVKNQAGREECHGAAMALVRARTTITKTCKAAREDAAAFQKAVIAAEKDLIAITQPEEDRLLALRDKWDEARAAEKAEAERIERLRITTIHERIAAIRAYADAALQAKTATAAGELIDRLMAESIEGFDEFDAEAMAARGLTLARMVEIRDTKAAEEAERERIAAEQEAERQRLAEERAALDRRRAEQARADKEAADKRAADEKRLADERAALAEQRADLERLRAATEAPAPVVAPEPAPAAPVVDTFEQERNALAEAIGAALPDKKPAVQLVSNAPVRTPHAREIINAAADRFDVDTPTAIEWIKAIDFTTL